MNGTRLLRCRQFVAGIHLIAILAVGVGQVRAAAEVYLTEIRLDRDLYTEDGRRLDRGGFDLEVRREEEGCSLVFLKGERSSPPSPAKRALKRRRTESFPSLEPFICGRRPSRWGRLKKGN